MLDRSFRIGITVSSGDGDVTKREISELMDTIWEKHPNAVVSEKHDSDIGGTVYFEI